MRATYIDAVQIGVTVVHVRFAGQSLDVPMLTLDICSHCPDREIQLAVARYLSLPDGAMIAYAIDRHPSGNLTIRPATIVH
jgi:hypothetical protein